MVYRRWYMAGALLLGLLATLTGCREKEVQQKLDRYLTEARWVWGFQGTALVAYHGHVVLAQGYGIANREFGELNTPETKYFIGSITKQFTAAAILLLAEQGRLKLTDPISAYLPTYPRPAAEQITIHQLLTHTSGIPNYTDNPEVLLRRTSPMTPTELLHLFWKQPLQFEPGTQFRYSNSGYIVLGAIIEAVSGQSYEAFLHHYIFGPLAMHHTGYGRRDAAVPERADGYTTDEDLSVHDAVPIRYSILHSAGALYSTVGDMLLWDRALSHRTILSQHSIDLMLTPYVADPGAEYGYGYGWQIDTLWGRVHTFHGGFIDGYNTTFERWPDQGICIIVFSNEDNAPVKKIARGLAAILFNEPHDFPVKKQPIPMSPATMAAYQGVFDLGRDHYRYVMLEDDTLHTWVTGQPREHLLPQAADTFFFAADNTRMLSFRHDSTGRIDAAILTDDHRSWLARRLPPENESMRMLQTQAIPLDSETLERYVGRYRMETILGRDNDEFNLTVTRKDASLFVAGKYTDEVQLFPRTETDFFHRNSDFELSFLVDRDNRVVGCLLRMGGVELVGWRIN